MGSPPHEARRSSNARRPPVMGHDERAMRMIPLPELGAIAECLAEIGATAQVAAVIEGCLRKPEAERLTQEFATWCRAPMEGEPPYRFLMGSPVTELLREEHEAQIEMELSAPCWVMPAPVTYAMWGLMADKADHVTRWGKAERVPVTHVSWFEASLYARWLDHWLRKHLPAVIPPGYQVALPTEAQREFFTRAGTTTAFWSGEGWSDLARVAWHDGNSGGQLHAVRELPPNAWGLHDVHGNVAEWCRSRFDADRAGEMDGPGTARGRRRAIRGGSFLDCHWWMRESGRSGGDPSGCRSAYCRPESPVRSFDDVGFRLVLSGPGGTAGRSRSAKAPA